MKVLLSFLFIIGLNLPINGQQIHLMSIDGAITPTVAEYVEKALETAVSDSAEALIIKLNTPGGLLTATRQIVTSFLESDIPVVVYVSPQGSQAASAGVFILMASHVAIMAPGTNTGAAHPVGMQGQPDSIMNEKATNDAAAFIRTISEKRHRNVEWGEQAVRLSVSITESEALNLNVIDTVAKNLNEVLAYLEGKTIETTRGEVTIRAAEAEIIEHEMTVAQKLLTILADPNVAYILFMLGIYGILFELYNPGAIAPGVVGSISLILAFYSLNTLPVNYAGLALIVLAVIMFILEIKVVSNGILSVGGTIALTLGSLMLFDTESAMEMVNVSWPVVLGVVLFSLLFFGVVIGFGVKAMKGKVYTGIEGMVGEMGVANTRLNPEGQVSVHGEFWNARTEGTPIKTGEKIKVDRVENLTLVVSKLNKE